MDRIGSIASSLRIIVLVLALSPAYAAEVAPPAQDAASIEPCVRAVELSQQNDHAKAIEQFTFCLNGAGLTDEMRAGVLVDRGNSYNKTEQPELAIHDFSQAIKLNPQSSVAFNNRGNTLKNRGRYQEALADFTKALELAPMNTMIYNNRANAYKAMGKYDQAAADLDKAVELQPSNAISFYNRACLESVRKKTAAACDWLGKAMEKGFTEKAVIRADRDLENIRGSACYEKLLGK